MRFTHRWPAVPALLLVLLFAGAPAQAKVQITFAYMGNAQESNVYKQVIEEFMRTRPHIQVVATHVGDGYFDKLRTQMAAGEAPDVFHVWTEGYMRPFQQQGVLLDLAPYLAKDRAFNLNDFPPNLLAAARYERGLYALPRDIALRVIFYNRDMFSSAGLSDPNEGWTWEDARMSARRLTKRDANGVAQTLGLDWGWWWGSWMNFVWMWGGEVTDSSVSKVTLDSRQALDGLNFMKAAFDEGWMGGPNHNWKDNFGFATGKVGMKWDGHWAVPWAREAVPFDWDVAMVPRGPAGRTTTLGSNWYAVWSKTKQPEAAVEFVKYLVGDGNRLYTRLGGAVPSRFSIMRSSDFLREALPPANRSVWLQTAPTGRWPPLTDKWEALVDRLMSPELEKAFKGEQSIEGAVAKIRATAPAILAP